MNTTTDGKGIDPPPTVCPPLDPSFRPDERSKRHWQAVAAAGLPELEPREATR